MSSVDIQLIKLIVELVISTIILTLLPIIRKYLENKLGTDKYEELLGYIEYAVRSAEQLYKISESKEKKRYVYNYILQKAQDLEVDLNPDDIDLLVEGVVNAVKYGDNE